MRYYLLFFLICMFLFSCSDGISQKEEDILKYDYLEPFILKKQLFLGGKLDVDNNNLEYSYKVIDPNKEMKNIESEALMRGWKLHGNTYSKYVGVYDKEGEIINVNITKTHSSINFKVHSE